ncbi:MAG: DNA translocase FtsK, partial [Paeniglutamicibacter sp.]
MAPRTSSQGEKKTTTRKPRASSSSAKQTRNSKSTPAAIEHDFPLPVRMVRSAWMGIARVTGGAFRKIGRDVHPDYAVRRDGTGLFLVIIAIVMASVEWWGLRGVGWYGGFVHAVAGGTFGFMAALMPPILLIGAIRLFRWPEEHRANNRVGIGLA